MPCFFYLKLFSIACHFPCSEWHTLFFGVVSMSHSSGSCMPAAFPGGPILLWSLILLGHLFGILAWLWYMFHATDYFGRLQRRRAHYAHIFSQELIERHIRLKHSQIYEDF
ncbi:hypothetical protein Cni_G18998 [Canna indica]|uniref:Uncharacterized protein n=1 Tax=Canna indica TaxID=4628 RepID=A0AAQ3QGJ9_9LILI|nr:hypothetical protein Cni_G18998 [Canna indica]